MKPDPRYGYYPRWPQDSEGWIHPGDVSVAKRMIPSSRIWRRDGADEPYVHLVYGEVRIRVHRTLWQEIPYEGLEISDWVEVKSQMQQNTYCIATILEMHWDAWAHAIRYQIAYREQLFPKRYSRADLRLVGPISGTGRFVTNS